MSDKVYDPKIHKNINLTTKSDEIACLDFGKHRAVLSCGHACDPNSITIWCITLLNDGLFKFTCPALNNGKKCNQEWSYDEVRHLGLLTEEEKYFFEEKLNENFIKNKDLKQCPTCHSYIERTEDELRINCLWCKKIGIWKRDYYFCWQCENEWKNPLSNNYCGNFQCSNKDLDALRNCKYIFLNSCKELGMIPSLRACPSCGKLVEHNGSGCKNIVCPECKIEFCFSCLLTTIECQKLKSGHSSACVRSVAPIQTTIPTLKFK